MMLMPNSFVCSFQILFYVTRSALMTIVMGNEGLTHVPRLYVRTDSVERVADLISTI